MKREIKNKLLCGILFWALCSGLLGLVFFSYMFGSGDSSFMDFVGWLYFFFSSWGHATIIMLLPFLLFFVPLSFIKTKTKIPLGILAFIYALIILLFTINRYVFQIYHFHINGFVLDMLFSEGASEIFVFS
ncbi:MAG: DUF3413 domain-containing protein, partial [Bacteroidota bacterium]|nr:DUF3413 domain-containing protein [Bacteroidota bacterium]